MKTIKKIELSEFTDEHQFSIGTYIRIYGVKDLAAKKDEDDYYEYMLADIPGDSEFKLITNVSREVTVFKAGYSLAMAKTIEGSNWVSGKELKRVVGIDKTFIIEY
jgi:hypothetical protein